MSVEERRRRFPLFNQRFQIGVLAVVALIALRLGLGFHFLYEGTWKIKHHDEFTAEPFLTQAKGPIAPLFYLMIGDINARQRLPIDEDAKGKKSIDSKPFTTRWDDIRQDFVAYYSPAGSAEDAAAQQTQLEEMAKKTYDSFCDKLDKYLAANTTEIVAHFASLDRFDTDKENHQTAPFQKQRRWERMMELRQEGNKWIKDIEGQETAFKNSLYSQLTDEQKEHGRVPGSWNPLKWKRIELINFAVTASLTAIGLCLMLGFCTPLAALGGAGFMCFVVMTQPAFPGIYPADPPVVGHALLVNKDFVEMLALLVVAATSAGRWGGLDFFLYRWIVNPVLAWCGRKGN